MRHIFGVNAPQSPVRAIAVRGDIAVNGASSTT